MSVVLGTTMASPADVPVRAGTEVPNPLRVWPAERLTPDSSVRVDGSRTSHRTA